MRSTTDPAERGTGERYIGLFDSGLGGLTVARELLRRQPDINVEYFGDTAHMPYGERSAEDVRDLTVAALQKMSQRRELAAAVIACNTATCYGLDQAQKELDFPVIGMVEPTARYIVNTLGAKCVALVATEGTVRSGAYQAAIRRLDPVVVVEPVAAPDLVRAIERDLGDRETLRGIVAAQLDELDGRGVDYDALVMGCTHFPLVDGIFQSLIEERGHEATLVNPAVPAIDELFTALGGTDDILGGHKEFFTSGDETAFAHTVRDVLRLDDERETTFGVL